MGKKKFENKKGVTFKLIYKSSDDQDSSADKTLSERIFSVIEQQKKTAVQENDKERQQILSQFTKEELGQAKPKRKKDPNAVNNAEHSGTISTHAKGRDDLWITHLHRMKEAAKAQLDQEEEEEEEEEERKKVEMSKKQALLAKLRDKAFKKTAASQLKKAKEAEEDGEEDGEGWESCEDEGEEGDDDEEEIEDVEEWEEEEEDEEDEEEEEYEEIEIDEETMKEMQRQQQEQQEETEEKEEEPIRLTKAKDPVEENKKGGKTVFEEIQQTKAPQVHFEDFPTLGTGEVMEFAHESIDIPMPPKPEEKTAEQKEEEKAEAEIDLKRTIVQGDVKMQRFDEMGLPIDGYNYYQHVVDANSGGQPQFAFTVTYDHVVNLPEDNDFRLEKMNVEERELYEALEHENQDGAYEDLDDDFFGQITKESNVKLEDGYFDPRAKAAKKVTFVEGEVTEISTTKEEVGKKAAGGEKETKGKGGKDSVLQRQDFNKVLDEHVAALKNRFRNERERNKARYGIESSDEDEDVEEVEDFSDEEEEEDDGVREVYDQIPFEKDVAMQQVMKKDLEEDSEDDEHVDDELFDERRSTKSSKTGQATMAESEIFSLARKAKLNIIKEKREGEKEREPRKEEKEEESDDEEEEDDDKGKVEEVFKKRERGETKEERKQRKEAVKQFKQERKEKKKKFKENFDNKKKEHLKINQRQATSLQGQTIYKLTV